MKLERRLVVLIALHSYAVGFGLLFLTEWATRLGGWDRPAPLFFARQAGVFHFLLASAYLLEYFRRGSVTLLLAAKATAVVFLTAMMLVEPAPWLVPLSAAADGLMGLAVWVVRRQRLRAAAGGRT